MTRRSLLGLIFLFFFLMIGFLVPEPVQNLELILAKPSWLHFWGTDSLGRDLFYLTIKGFSFSCSIGMMAAFIAFAIGIFLGVVPTAIDPRLDSVLMRLNEMLSSLPQLVFVSMILMMLKTSLHQAQGLLGVALAIGLTHWMSVARVARSAYLQEKSEPHLEGASAIGAGPWRIFIRHLIPGMRKVLWIHFLASLPSFLLYESMLSFLGVGLQSPMISIGTLINEGWKKFSLSPHLLLGPGCVLIGFLLFMQLISPKSDEGRQNF